MLRNKLNNLIEKKYFLVAFSIITSIVLWMYVTYIDNPQQTNTVSGIEIEYKGEDALKENNLIITGTDRKTLTIKFSGRRNSIWKLNNSNVTATVDLEEIVDAGARTGIYQLSYDVNYPSGISSSSVSVEDVSSDYITVTVEALMTLEVPVKGDNNSSVAEGYQAEPMEFSPDKIEISGTEAAVSKVAYAKVVVEQKNLSETYEEDAGFTLVDKNGVAVDDSDIKKSVETVHVKIPVIMVKTVPLKIDFKYTNAITADNFDEYVSVKLSQDAVTLSGDAELLGKINEITLGTIDLSDFAVSTKETMSIPIPNDMTNVTGKTEVTVEIEIKNFATQGYAVANISAVNETKGYTTKIETQSLSVRLRGSKADLDAVESTNIRVVADLSELGEATGTYSVLAKVYIDGFKYVDTVGDYYVTVTVTKG